MPEPLPAVPRNSPIGLVIALIMRSSVGKTGRSVPGTLRAAVPRRTRTSLRSFPAQDLVYSFNARAQVPFKSAVGRLVVLRSHEFVGKVLLWRDSVGIVVGVFVFDS